MGRAWTTVVSAVPSRAEELRRLDAAVRAPLALSTRVGVVGVAGGSGCSTVGGLVASVLAARREHRTLLVNASRSPRSALWHAGLTAPAPSSTAHETERRAARRSEEAAVGLAQTVGGLYCLDLVAPAVVEEPVEGDAPEAAGRARGTAPSVPTSHDARWWEAVAPAGRFFDFVVTDWGVRDASTLGAVLSASTAVVVVATADRSSIQRAVDLARTVQESGVQPLVVVDDVRRQRTAAVTEILRLLPVPAVAFPYDRAHGAASPVGGHRLRASTTLAALRLAAALVDAAGRRVAPRRSVA